MQVNNNYYQIMLWIFSVGEDIENISRIHNTMRMTPWRCSFLLDEGVRLYGVFLYRG